jgi:hypothetical protein
VRYYELTINTKDNTNDTDSLLEKVISYLPNPPIHQQKQNSFMTLEFYTEPEEIQELEKKLKEDSLKYIILAKGLPKKTIVRPIRKPRKSAEPKVELKEIDKKLEEILKET